MGACVTCGQQITNPLCPERLAEQMSVWLAETKPELMVALNNKTEDFLNRPSGDDFCVVTGKRMDICPYCYTEHIFDWLVSLKLGFNILEEYLIFFHFDEGRLGYWKKAEELGIIS
ncbi:hypothetical protein K9M18_03650 [Candidatus Woesearchaeota archaeon]|nr:hypothetical protein [Candidatus Woesearchaeota archaeon]MCF8013076.1 hypothetical protein [Candidatus Woesearchaeota archaeon]